MSSRIYQRQIPIIITSAIIAIIAIEYFAPQVPALTTTKEELQLWASIIFSFVMLFGYVTLLMNHVRQATTEKRTVRKYLIMILLAVVVIFVILGLTLEGGPSGVQYSVLYKYLALYIAGGMYTAWAHHPYNAYRFIKVTSPASTIFLITWLFLVFRELSVIVFAFPPLYDVGTWIEQVINASAQRVSLACAGVGQLILGIRALVGKEPGLIETEVL
jgi:hypothetical protein